MGYYEGELRQIALRHHGAELDEKFDNGEDVSDYFDWSKARRPISGSAASERGLPAWMVRDLDKEAGRLGVTRQSLIKMWIAEKLCVTGALTLDTG